MKRSEKYPNTSTFEFHNASPKGKITDDCVIRAISKAAGIPYDAVLIELVSIWRQTGFMPTDSKNYSKYLEKIGFSKYHQPRKLDNKKYTGKEFCKELQNNHNKSNIIAHIGSHHIVAITNNKVQDIWDSTNGAIGVYWKR